MDKIKTANMYADYMLKTRCTIGQCGEIFGKPKSTIHWYLHHYCTGWLRIYRIKRLLRANYIDRHRRAGISRHILAIEDRMARRYDDEKTYLSECLDILK